MLLLGERGLGGSLLADGVVYLLIEFRGFLLLFLKLGGEVFLFLFEVVEHVLMLLLIACKALLLPFARLQRLLFVLAISLQSIVARIYLRLYLLDTRCLLLPITSELLHVAHAAHHLLEVVRREDKEQRRLLHARVMRLAD